MTYLDELSVPANKVLSYICGNCKELFLFRPLSERTIRALYKGRVVFRAKLAKWEFDPPPL